MWTRALSRQRIGQLPLHVYRDAAHFRVDQLSSRDGNAMTFWLKFLHIAAMAVWFTGLSFLPRLIGDQLRAAGDVRWPSPLGRTLYFGVMTPAAVTTIVLGTILLADGFAGAWLPAKLSLVAVAVLLHVLFGKWLFDPPRATLVPRLLLRLCTWLPLLLLLGIAALAAGQPQRLPPLGGV